MGAPGDLGGWWVREGEGGKGRGKEEGWVVQDPVELEEGGCWEREDDDATDDDEGKLSCSKVMEGGEETSLPPPSSCPAPDAAGDWKC